MLLDTSGLLCLFDEADAWHHGAATLLDGAPTRLTHNYVLAEFVPLCLSRRLPRAAALAFADRLTNTPDVTVVWVDAALHAAAMELLGNQLDKNYSVCDAVSFLLMAQRGLTESLTLDHHFEQAGFRRLLG
jgi:predicted nucleic acid-binding protein